jgi:hypothetical protein
MFVCSRVVDDFFLLEAIPGVQSMDDFISLWSGDFLDYVRGDECPSHAAVQPNPGGAHQDSDTEVSESPVTQYPPTEVPQVQAPTAVSGRAAPVTPPLPPWKRMKVASAVAPKARPQAPADGQATTEQQSADPTVEAALKQYRAAEEALNKVAHESLYGPYNAIYYGIEQKVAKEKGIGWRDRGPRGADQPLVWKSQRWRANGQRYSNRGGKNRQHFAAKYGTRAGTPSSGSGQTPSSGSRSNSSASGQTAARVLSDQTDV